MKCHTCSHPDRALIDRALVAGEPSRRVLAARHGLSKSGLAEHMRNHISPTLRTAIARTTREDGLVNSFSELVTDARRLQKKAEQAKDFGVALQAVRELTRLLELAAAHAPKPVESKQPKVRLVFTSRGPQTVIGDEPPAIETTATTAVPTAEAPEGPDRPAEETGPAREPAQKAQPAPPPVDKLAGGHPVNRAAPGEPPDNRSPDWWVRQRREEEARDAAEDADNADARRGVGKSEWDVF